MKMAEKGKARNGHFGLSEELRYKPEAQQNDY